MTESQDIGSYVGTELELFAKATNWKSYYASRISRWIRGSVLEVGAGLGGTTRVLMNEAVSSWVCLEPDAALVAKITDWSDRLDASVRPRPTVGFIEDLDPAERFDCILYIDVLEHIEDDRAELVRAASRLAPGGCLVVLAPAHQFLFSEFDRQIGHFRRYDRHMLRAIRPQRLREEDCFYLDSAGTLLSLANRLLLRSDAPTEAQIAIWDRAVVPVSRVLDAILGYRVGKTVIVVWSNPRSQ
jgi:SAM-dependent methyltransferase